jgi:cytochrome b subunit of formate dehydrogenase
VLLLGSELIFRFLLWVSGFGFAFGKFEFAVEVFRS